MADIIDAHHHLWQYDTQEYSWISPEMEVLQTDFLPADLESAMESAGISGSVAVQARQSIQETRWLLDQAEKSTGILGVVGWLPLQSPALPGLLAQFSENPRLKGLRHVVQDEPDPDFILGSAFNKGIEALLGTGLTYDILIHARHLPQTIEFAGRHPQQAFVLDHCGKPAIGEGSFETWRDNMRLLAQHQNVSCKLSGLATQTASGHWTLDALRPYLDAALEAFGPTRLMAGSDWPVCLLATTYARWWSALRQWGSALDESSHAAIFGGTARRVYHLGD
jgi:L-fuconolactonase